MEPPTRSADGSQMEVLKDLLREVLRPLFQEAVAAGIQGQLSAPPPAAAKEYLQPKEVEAAYGLNSKTLARWRSEGRGPTYNKDGSLILYRRQDVEAYLKSHRVRTIEQPGLK